MNHANQASLADPPPSWLDREAAMSLVAAAGDIALLIGVDGVVRDALCNDNADGIADEVASWIGRKWADIVAVESQSRVEALIRDASTSGSARRRQINHITSDGRELSIAFTAARMNGNDHGLLVVGRDTRAIASLQLRLAETQQAMERDYWQLRHVETRYRLLFQVSSEAILVVDATTYRIVDANEAAGLLFEKTPDKLVGRTFPTGVSIESTRALEDALVSARAAGRSDTIETRLGNDGPVVQLAVSCFRQDTASLFLVRLLTTGTAPVADGAHASEIVELMAGVPDGFVVTDSEGRIISTNLAFLDQVQLTGEQEARGRLLSEWIGRPGADLGVFLATLRKHGVIRLMLTGVQGAQGGTSEAEISASFNHASNPPVIGFIVRDVARRVSTGPQGARDLTTAVEQLTSLVGRVALRDLVRDTSDMVERHFIEAALQLTEDNRTAAAQVLGLSRQSLYVKLRRYNVAGGDEGGDDTLDSQPEQDRNVG